MVRSSGAWPWWSCAATSEERDETAARGTRRDASAGGRSRWHGPGESARRRAAAVLVAALGAGLVATAGCGGRHAVRPVTAPPEWVYPRPGAPRALELVTLLADPWGARFEQGGAPPVDGFVRPVVARPAADGVYVLDAGRGAVMHLRYDADGSLVAVEMLGRRRAPFPSAVDMAVTPDASVWVSDSREARVWVFAPGARNPRPLGVAFSRPVGLAWHAASGRMLVADLAAHRIVAVDPHGATASPFGADSVVLDGPSYLAAGPDGSVFVVEALASRVTVFYADGSLSGRFGAPGDGPGFFARPKGIAVDAEGHVYVADAVFDNVQIFTRDGQLLLTLGTSGRGPGRFRHPMGVRLDADGTRLFVADMLNRRIQVFEWSRSRAETTPSTF